MALVAAGALAGSPPAGGQAEGCEQPYSPVYVQRGYPFNDPSPTLNSEGVWRPAPGFFPAIDLDNDGTVDVEQSPSAVPGMQNPPPTAHLPAGDLVLSRSGVNLQLFPAGDLDGDHGQELWVTVMGSAPGSSGIDEAYVVPYDAPAGTHDPADVGIRVEAGLVFPVDDRTGDGVPDILSVDAPTFGVGGTTQVLSGGAIIAAGVGTDARGTSTIETIPGAALAFAFHGPVDTILTVQELGGSDLLVRVVDGPVTTLLTNRPAVVGFSPSELRPGGIRVLDGQAGRFVTASADSRSGGGTYWWSLDDPCSPLFPGPLPASRPASPVPATPRYTG